MTSPQTPKAPARQNNDGAALHRKTFSIEALREFLRYEPETGNLYWLPRDAKWFTEDRHCKGWNLRNAGRRVISTNGRGYATVHIYSRTFLAHRVIWAIVHGEWPDEIDHIDGDPTNNRLSNLRNVSHRENGCNRRTYVTAKSGFAAIRHLPKKRTTPERWRVVFRRSGNMPGMTGTFFTLEEAITFRDQKYREAGFHENHGRAHRNREAAA